VNSLGIHRALFLILFIEAGLYSRKLHVWILFAYIRFIHTFGWIE